MSPRCTVTLALAVLFSVAVPSTRAADDAVRMPPTPSSVLVVNPPNDPVKTTVLGTANVTGSVTLEGTPSVNATITNTPAVTLAGTPTVAVARKLTVVALAPQQVVIPAGQEMFWSMDVSEYEEVRVSVLVPDINNQLTLYVYDLVSAIDAIALNGQQFVSPTYRVPGTLLTVDLSNSGGREDTEASIVVYGRP